MECGKINDCGDAHYSSEVPIDSSEEMRAFLERIRDWANRSGVVLGEGHISTYENFGSNPNFTKTLVAIAPVFNGPLLIDRYYGER